MDKNELLEALDKLESKSSELGSKEFYFNAGIHAARLQARKLDEPCGADEALKVASEILLRFANSPADRPKIEEWEACYAKLFTQMNEIVKSVPRVDEESIIFTIRAAIAPIQEKHVYYVADAVFQAIRPYLRSNARGESAPVKIQPPWDTFKKATCRGAYYLGTACGTCEKCQWELSLLSTQPKTVEGE